MTPLHIRFGGYQPPTSVHSRAAAVFGQALTTRLGDGVTFELTGDIVAAGHQAADLLTMVESGALTICYFSTSYLATRVPEFALLDLPFTITDRTQACALLDGPCGALLADRLQATSGFRVLGFWDNGFRHVTNALRPIRTLADCQGLRLRTLPSAMHARVFRLLGFEPVALDVKDLLVAVPAGTIDAQENPLTTIYHFGIHTHHRYITLTSHFFGAVIFLCHQASYAAWPAEVQQAVTAAAAEATAAQRRYAAAEDAAVLARLSTAHNKVIHLTEAERARFLDAVAPLIAEQRQALGARLVDYVL